jgi:hypothetical protein
MFDKLLLDHVAQSGCHVLQGDHVTDFAFDTDGVTNTPSTTDFARDI